MRLGTPGGDCVDRPLGAPLGRDGIEMVIDYCFDDPLKMNRYKIKHGFYQQVHWVRSSTIVIK